jgi:hypothetical protein
VTLIGKDNLSSVGWRLLGTDLKGAVGVCTQGVNEDGNERQKGN